MEAVYEAWYRARFPLVGRLLELGIYQGDSVRWWAGNYRPAVHVGLDLAGRPAGVPDRYRHFQGSQDDRALLAAVVELGPFDLVVDDAAHDGLLAAESFEVLWPAVAAGGCYVIEDWQAPWHYVPATVGADVDLVTLVGSLVREVGLCRVGQPPDFAGLPDGARWGDLEAAEVRPGLAAFWKVA